MGKEKGKGCVRRIVGLSEGKRGEMKGKGWEERRGRGVRGKGKEML